MCIYLDKRAITVVQQVRRGKNFVAWPEQRNLKKKSPVISQSSSQSASLKSPFLRGIVRQMGSFGRTFNMNNMTANSMRLDEKRGRMTARVDLELWIIVECSSVKSRFNGSERSRVRVEGERAMFREKAFYILFISPNLDIRTRMLNWVDIENEKETLERSAMVWENEENIPFSHHSKPLLRPSSVAPALKIRLFIWFSWWVGLFESSFIGPLSLWK